LPDEKQDQWIRGIEEWVVMADAVVPSSNTKLMIDELCRI